jgi:hypothetical protein
VESSHESEELRGSFFTHHFVAGLRGAAAPRGESVVTLTQAFGYARERTVRDTAAVASVPQHPSFSMNLHGRSDLPLARLDESPSSLAVQEVEGPLQLIELTSGLVVLEMPSGERALKLSVAPGRYLVRRQAEGRNYAREVEVQPGGNVEVREQDLVLAGLSSRAAKGLGLGSEGWPLSLNDRPLTLGQGLAQIELGLGIDTSYDSFGKPISAYPALAYGFTDRLTGWLNSGGGICVGTGACDTISATPRLGVTWLGFESGLIELGLQGSASYNSTQQQLGLGTGFDLRIGGGRQLAFTLSPRLTTNPVNSNGSAWDVWSYEVTGLLVLQATQRLALQASIDEQGWFTSNSSRGPLAAAFAATWALSHRFDLRAWFTFKNLLTQKVTVAGTEGPGDERQVGLALAFRP